MVTHIIINALYQIIIENSKIFQNSLNSASNSIIENEDDNNESNLENTDDSGSENISLDTSIDVTLNNLLSSFKVL